MDQMFIKLLDERKSRWSTQEQSLKLQGAQDEASFARIRYNISDVCRTVYAAFARMEDAEKRFLDKLTEFENTWRTAMERAQQHNDVESACIEQVKLDELRAVRALYEDSRA